MKTKEELESENKSLRHIIEAWKADKDVRVELKTLRFKTSQQERFIWWVWNVLAPNITDTANAIVKACTYESEEEARAGKYALPKKCFDMLARLMEYSNGIYNGTYLDTQISMDVNNKDNTCVWQEVDDPEVTIWETACKEQFYLNDGTPGDNRMNYCCYCGRRLAAE